MISILVITQAHAASKWRKFEMVITGLLVRGDRVVLFKKEDVDRLSSLGYDLCVYQKLKTVNVEPFSNFIKLIHKCL